MPSSRWHPSLAWLVTRATSSAESSDLAVLQLWARVAGDATDAIALELLALDDKRWRRLGRLLFAADVHTVRAVVSTMRVLVTNTQSSKASSASTALRRRMWSDEWRALLLEKLRNCMALLRETVPSDRHRLVEEYETLCLRLVDTMAALVHSREHELLPRDLVWWIDVLVEQSKARASDRIACQATSELIRLVADASSLHEDVRAYLLAVDVVFEHQLAALLAPDTSRRHARSRNSPREQRSLLSLDLLVLGAGQSPDVLAMLDREHRVLDLVMQDIHGNEDDHVPLERLERSLTLLTLTLASASGSASTLTAIRLSGALISLSWLLIHRAPSVRSLTSKIWCSVLALSPRQDLLRALVEQGCVLVFFLVSPESVDARTLLIPWVIDGVDSDVDGQFVDASIVGISRSSNPRLQRNVLLALCLLRHRSVVVRETFETCDVVHDILRLMTDDVTLPVQLLRLGLLCLDKRSALWLDPHDRLQCVKTSSFTPPACFGGAC
ncbi:hypothetical protein ATCC90586_003331 [Pythium insidiosum]|nr:hypothetical protein ATCC90586_003331 [Pythium insidiosum]